MSSGYAVDMVFYDNTCGVEKKRLIEADILAVSQGPSQDAAQHIPATFVGRQNSVGNEKRGSTAMIAITRIAMESRSWPLHLLPESSSTRWIIG